MRQSGFRGRIDASGNRDKTRPKDQKEYEKRKIRAVNKTACK
jgi:hypothetical protein